MSRALEIFDTPGHACDRAAGIIASLAPSTIALSGGSSPKPLYQTLARLEALRNCELWLVDERCVPADHRDSNTKMIRETLGVERLHRPPTEFGCDVAASAYDDELHALLGEDPTFDVIVLGMGPDGHTASLFPDAPEINDRTHAAVATAQPHNGHRRVTLTLPVLNRAKSVIMLVFGEEKARAFAQIQDGDLLPAGKVLGAIWMLDKAAATPPPPPMKKRGRYDPIEGQQTLFDV